MEYDQLITEIKKGISEKKNPRYYMSFPGKEIYYALPHLDKKQFEKLASVTARAFPKKRLGNSVHLSCFIRYVYGCFSKQGMLNKKSKDDIISNKPNWSLSDLFMDTVFKYMSKYSRLYGVVLYYEMKAHRVGDYILLNKDYAKTEEMIGLYQKAANSARVLKAWKNTYSSYYWAAKYMYEIHGFDRSKFYCLKFLDNVEKFGDSILVRGKVTWALNLLKGNLNPKEWSDFLSKIKGYRNKVFIRMRYTKYAYDISELKFGASYV